MHKLVIFLIFIGGIFLHIYFLGVNTILDNADGFAYLQMSDYLKELSIQGFGTGWFGPLYSIPIAILDFFLDNNFMSAQIVNIILFTISAILLFEIGKKYLNNVYNALLLILFFISPTLIHYNISIISENIYLPLFLGLILAMHNLVDNLSGNKKHISMDGVNFSNTLYKPIQNSIIVAFILALMYYTRAEAFIYFGAISISLFLLFLFKDIKFSKFAGILTIILVSFFVFISPYLFLLHSITGEWGLTNKGTSNLRQATLRDINNMDGSGFEKAVGELTEDKHYLIAGFAGGLDYNKPETGISTSQYFIENKGEVWDRFLENQKKLYFKIIPKILFGETYKNYSNENSYLYNNRFFWFTIIIPFLLILYGGILLVLSPKVLISLRRNFLIIVIPLFIIASLFFTIFFVLDRYFIVFLPMFFLVMVYGLQEIPSGYDNHKTEIGKLVIGGALLIGLFSLGDSHYYTYNKPTDDKFEIKKISGEWIKENYKQDKWNNKNDLRILERFPIVTHYSGTKKRFITPYTDNIEDLIEYARFNEIDILVVDTLDFRKYRPKLLDLLNEKQNHNGLKVLKIFKKPGEKVVLYEIK